MSVGGYPVIFVQCANFVLEPSVFKTLDIAHDNKSEAGFFNAIERGEIIHPVQHDACRFTIMRHGQPTLHRYDTDLLVS